MKKISIIYTIVFVLSSMIITAQPAGNINIEKYLAAATQASSSQNHYESIDICTQAYEATGDARFLSNLVESNYVLRDYDQAIKWAKMYMNESKGTKDIRTLKHYASALKSTGKYKDALNQYQKLLQSKNLTEAEIDIIKNEMKGAELALKSDMPKGIALKNMGATINKSSSEYSPFLMSDGTLYYSALNNDDIVDVSDNPSYSTKIYQASKGSAGYNTPVVLDNSINDPNYFQSNISISEDGRTMLFARQQVSNEGSIVSSKLYSSQWMDGKWSKPKVLHDNNNVVYKSPSFGMYEGQAVVYFASDMSISSGYDIYYAPLNSNGELSGPKKLGSFINTSQDEESPYYKDGYLYFSSKGHTGFGGYDIYRADLSNQKVINMGKPYNSPADDLYFMMADDYSGVMISNRNDASNISLQGPTCCNDIYSIDLVNLQLEAILVDADTGEEIKGEISIMDSNGHKLTSSISDASMYSLSPDMNYTISVNKAGYEALAPVDINTENMWTSDRITKQIKLTPIKVVVAPKPEIKKEVITVAEPIVLEEILFDYNDDKILTKAEGDLNYLLKIMRTYPDIKIRISSHTDARGGKDYNQQLSQRRSSSVRNWLIAKGIDRNRIDAVGLGSARPLKVYQGLADRYEFLAVGDILDKAFIANLGSAEKEIAHQLNRRSEFEITAGPRVILKKQ